MSLPAGDVPLYNHSLLDIETWLRKQGCEQDEADRNIWHVSQDNWTAELELDVEKIIASYRSKDSDGARVQRSFPYALSREDLQSAIFAGP
jgi:hypothetical protein